MISGFLFLITSTLRVLGEIRTHKDLSFKNSTYASYSTLLGRYSLVKHSWYKRTFTYSSLAFTLSAGLFKAFRTTLWVFLLNQTLLKSFVEKNFLSLNFYNYNILLLKVCLNYRNFFKKLFKSDSIMIRSVSKELNHLTYINSLMSCLGQNIF